MRHLRPDESYDGPVEAFGKAPVVVLGRICASIVAEHDGFHGPWLIPQDRPIAVDGLEYAVEWVHDRFCVYIASVLRTGDRA
jgi:hypothetical protein